MSKTIEEAANEFVDKQTGLDFIGECACEQAFIAGANFSLSHQWRSVEDELPEDGEWVLIHSKNGIEPAVWNEHYQCWDDSEGDDYMYNKEAVDCWLSIPSLNPEQR